MNAEQFINIADSARVRVLSTGADVNASNYLVHAALLRALTERPLEDLVPDVLNLEIERVRKKHT